MQYGTPLSKRRSPGALPLGMILVLFILSGITPDLSWVCRSSESGALIAGSSDVAYAGTAQVAPPEIDFTTDVTSGVAPFRVVFAQIPNGKITSHRWDFGDGTTSTGYGGHVYRTPGTYTVSLTVEGPGGTDTETKPDYIHVSYSAPTARFSATPTTGKPPLGVTFTNGSLGTVTQWLWDFGDGDSSGVESPYHTYTTGGVYTVSLTAVGPGGSNTLTRTDYITVHNPPQADFKASPTSGMKPLTVHFSDNSTGKITSRLWDFGDGQTSGYANPSHIYRSAGQYTVKLTVTGPGGSDTMTKADLITVGNQRIAADFTADVTSGVEPLRVVFTNTSQGKVTSHLWDFGDGVTSSGYGGHVYRDAGTYTVKLTVNGPYGSDTKTKVDYIHVGDSPPIPKFSAETRSGGIPFEVQFVNNSVGNVTSWLWDFGDGKTSTEKSPSHSYEAGGVYTVKLTAIGPGGSEELTKVDFITAYGPPQAGFTANPTTGIRPLTVAFADTSTGKVTSRLWDFGDGATSVWGQPSHVYSPGTYTVKLTVTGPGGSDTVTKENLITVKYPEPVAKFSADVTSGGVPLKVTFSNQSTGPITSRTYDYGDGEAGSNAVHVYKVPGTYTVSLGVTGPGGSDNMTRNDYITVYTPPSPNFTADVRSGRAPLEVAFSDMSTGIVSSFAWDFGDGTTSSEQNPSHAYGEAGTYDVALTVTGPGGMGTATKVNYITVKPPLRDVNFIGNFKEASATRTVTFTNTSSGAFTSWLWDFGDGGSQSTEQHPTHTFSAPGTYTVTLTATGASGSASASNDVTLLDGNPVGIGSIDFYYNSGDKTGLDPWSTSIPEVGPLDAVSVIRTNISWGEFEPVNNQYHDGITPKVDNPNRYYALSASLKSMLQRMDADNMRALLTIRAFSTSNSEFWAFDSGTQTNVSHVPKDLESSANAEYGYSKEYYDFVHKLMETIDRLGYGPKLIGVMVENEMNSTANFTGTVDEYCRMAATARKAVKDVFPDKPVYCGGLQGGPSIWVLLSKYLEAGQQAEALQLYHGANPYDGFEIGTDIDKLILYTSNKMKSPECVWIKEALASSLYQSGRSPEYAHLPLDGLNFHYYDVAKAFDQIHKDLLKASTDLPIVSNEMGLHVEVEVYDRKVYVRQEMVKKLAKAKFYLDGFGLWFALRGKGQGHPGMLINAQHIINVNNTKAFKIATDLLAAEETAKANFSDAYNEVVRYEFLFPSLDRIVAVVWSESDEESCLEWVPADAVVYDTLGGQVAVSDQYVTLTPGMPVFMVR